MPLKDFLEYLGIEDYKVKTEGWTKDESEVLNLTVDGPYVDEWGEMICSVKIPDALWKVLTDNICKNL